MGIIRSGVLLTWFAVALSADLSRGMAMPCTLDGTDLALWRSAAGDVHVWGDRCPHRGMRLSQGFVRGEALSCIYHGWQYGGDGSCVSIPAHPNLVPPKTICATTYLCAESNGLIWASLDDVDEAPPSVGHVVAVRSFQVNARVSRVAEYLGTMNAQVITLDDPVPVAVALQPVTSEITAVHGMTAQACDRVVAARWLETQRQIIEEASP